MLEIVGLKKVFGNNKVIDGLDMKVEDGSVFGFLGANGSGKTTTMKMIKGLTKPDAGKIIVNGKEVKFGESSKDIGYLPDVPAFYSYMKPKEYMKLCAKLSGLTDYDKRIEELLDLVGLEGVNRKIKGFSRGMMQRLGIAQALLNKPKLLICDEPTSALDPIGRKEILDILKSVSSETTIVFSTHVLVDVERICDTVGILNGGKLEVTGKIEELEKSFISNRIEIEIKEKAEEFAKKAKEIEGISSIKIKDNSIIITADNVESSGSEIVKMIAQGGYLLERYQVAEPNLEEVFVEVVKK